MFSRERYFKQPVAGLITFNTSGDLRGELRHVSVNPSSTTTTYDLSLVDDNNTTVYQRKGRKGTFTDDSPLAVYGIYTIKVANASASNKTWTITLIENDNI